MFDGTLRVRGVNVTWAMSSGTTWIKSYCIYSSHGQFAGSFASNDRHCSPGKIVSSHCVDVRFSVATTHRKMVMYLNFL